MRMALCCTFAAMVFELPLAEEKVKRQQVVTLHLIVSFAFVATGVLLFLLQYLAEKISPGVAPAGFLHAGIWGTFILLAGIVLFGLVLFRSGWLIEKKVNRLLRITELALLLCFASFAAITHLFIPAMIYGLIAAAILFAIYWESVSDNTLYIYIDERGIRLPLTSRKRFLDWWEVERIILRFGVLTIGCHDNRLFQWNINAITFDKEDFQRFCADHIAANKEKRKKYVW